MIANIFRSASNGPIVQPLALLSVGGGIGFWFGLGNHAGANQILAAAILAIAAIAAIIWRYRDRARQRWQLVLNDYADREIARSRGLRISRR